MKQKFTIRSRLVSFKYAYNGFKIAFSEEWNFRIHMLLGCCVVILGLYLNINQGEWVGIILSMGLVLSTELINTSLEKVADFLSPERNEKIKVVKDLAAAAVLVSALTSIIVGLLIFLPKVLS